LIAGQRGFGAVGDEVERRTTVHDQGIALVVGEHEHGGVERGLWPPPAFPVTTPLAADRAEHVAAHDERLGVRDRVELSSILLRRVEHPGMEYRLVGVAERVLLGLVVAGREAVR
jgi:hypothetical protein